MYSLCNSYHEVLPTWCFSLLHLVRDFCASVFLTHFYNMVPLNLKIFLMSVQSAFIVSYTTLQFVLIIMCDKNLF
jgi:hypothetical protein